jgi:hypothetical protein
MYAQNNGTLGNQLLVLPNGTVADFFTEFIATNVQGGVTFSERLSEIRSTDGGASWTKPTVVSQMTPNGAFDPATGDYIRLSPDGSDLVDYWGATSGHGGQSWSPDTRVSPSSFPARTAPSAGGPMIGDYEALAHSGNTFVTAFEVTKSDPSNPTDIDLASFN